MLGVGQLWSYSSSPLSLSRLGSSPHFGLITEKRWQNQTTVLKAFAQTCGPSFPLLFFVTAHTVKPHMKWGSVFTYKERTKMETGRDPCFIRDETEK